MYIRAGFRPLLSQVNQPFHSPSALQHPMAFSFFFVMLNIVMSLPMICVFCLARLVAAGDVTAPLRSARLQWHLQWDSMLALAETVLRERVETELLESFSQLRAKLLHWSPHLWASADLPKLRWEIEMTWPQSEVFDVGHERLLRSLRDHFKSLEEDWEQMKIAIFEWNSEAQRLSSHVPVNFEILLKQASVLQGLLAAAPGFAQCLEKALVEARDRRPSDSVYESAVLYVKTAERQGSELRAKVSVFSAQQQPELDLERITHAVNRAMHSLEISDLRGLPGIPIDWCLGPGRVASEGTSGEQETCEEISKKFAHLRTSVLAWFAHPQEFLHRFSRWQFSVAPNVSRIEVLTTLLERTFACQYKELGFASDQRTHGLNFSHSLGQIASDDKASIDEEYHILHNAMTRLLRIAEDLKSLPETAVGAFGGLRSLVDLKFALHLLFDEASTWAFRIKTRGNGLQLRLEELAGRLSWLHHALQSVPDYRSLAFREIHSAGHWGRSSSGSGSSEEATSTIATRILGLLQERQQRTAQNDGLSILDVGCGWGEWLPSMLLDAMNEGTLEKLLYFGVDIAERPIKALCARFGGVFDFAVMDACRDTLPYFDFDLVLVRHLFQHLNLADALSLLSNVLSLASRRRQNHEITKSSIAEHDKFSANGDEEVLHQDRISCVRRFDVRTDVESEVDQGKSLSKSQNNKDIELLLSSWPDAKNFDLVGGSSAFEALAPSYNTESRFKGYDLRKPPFNLPEPLRVWRERSGEELLLYPIQALHSIDFGGGKSWRC